VRIISLGWGVQSFALAAMSALGVLPKVDAAVHADTGLEKRATYRFQERWIPWLEERGIPVIFVSNSAAVNDAFADNNDRVYLPAYTKDKKGKTGQLLRTCTHRWKIVPQRRWFSKELKRRGLKKTPGIIDLWFGITLDEWDRMRDSDIKYVNNVYPFMQMFDPPMSRLAVIKWLQDNGLEVPPKSACVCCPYQNRQSWQTLQAQANMQEWMSDRDWMFACALDKVIRNKRPGYDAYLLRKCEELSGAELEDEQVLAGQLSLFAQEECTGTCFL